MSWCQRQSPNGKPLGRCRPPWWVSTGGQGCLLVDAELSFRELGFSGPRTTTTGSAEIPGGPGERVYQVAGRSGDAPRVLVPAAGATGKGRLAPSNGSGDVREIETNVYRHRLEVRARPGPTGRRCC